MTRQELESKAGQAVYWYDSYEGKMQPFTVPPVEQIEWHGKPLAIFMDIEQNGSLRFIEVTDIYETRVACLEAIVEHHAEAVVKILSCLDGAQSKLNKFKRMLAYAKEAD